jgi:hypothetical protein
MQIGKLDANWMQIEFTMRSILPTNSPFQPPARHFGNFPGKSTLIFSGVDQNKAQHRLVATKIKKWEDLSYSKVSPGEYIPI